MRDGLNGIVSDSCAAFERRSDRPERKTPAFQSLLHAGGDAFVSPNSEGSLQEIVDYRLGVPLAKSPAVDSKTRKGGNVRIAVPFSFSLNKRLVGCYSPSLFFGLSKTFPVPARQAIKILIPPDPGSVTAASESWHVTEPNNIGDEFPDESKSGECHAAFSHCGDVLSVHRFESLTLLSLFSRIPG